MFLIRLKAGVSLDKCHPKIFFAMAMAARVWEQLGAEELWITAANEPGHKTNLDPQRQFHRLPDGSCQAFDNRVHQFNYDQKREARRILASILGRDYDVLLEKVDTDQEHIHVQYDPNRPGTVI